MDALTYAGNLETLKPVENKPNYKFVKGDIADREFVFGLFEKEKPDVITGWCGLDGTSGDKLHIFYSIEPEHRSRGYATEAARALLNYAFQDAGAAFVNGGCYQENQASYRVMEKAGMLPAGSEENGDPLFYLDRETYLKKQELTQ